MRRVAPGPWRNFGEQALVWPGRNHPLGSDWSPEATNFAVHAPAADAVWVCLFDDEDRETRHPLTERTLGIWHGAVPGVPTGARYGYRVAGPWEPTLGLRFNAAKLLVDPFARAMCGEVRPAPPLHGFDMKDPARRSPTDSAPYTMRSVVLGPDGFDWRGDRRPETPWHDTVVYEMHVKGMTQLHDRVPEPLRGTYAGLASSAVVDYLLDLGVTAVELLPVHQFVSEPELLRRGLRNYWGYNSIGFFAPHHAYSASGDRGQQVTEFKQMVSTYHAAGLEVLLDVVYNHTAEAGPPGPTLSFRGLDDRGTYHRARPDGDAVATAGDDYWDVTGCGNTVDSGGPFGLRLILDSLRYWAQEMHVDGFRFDLLPALARRDQHLDMASAMMTAIGQDPVLRHLKLVAEPWDASADGYAVGACPPPWVEWNDQYRDEIRDFWRGVTPDVRAVATRLSGSADLYADDGRSPYASVNFVTAHDGFTLRDLVTYETKHNQANGEDNADGSNNHRSSNHGIEGETDDPAIRSLRRRQAANLIATLCLSNGVPMLTAGDERGRTQRGNNNAYAQDNEISWVDWRPDDAWLDVYEVAKAALALRRRHPALRQRHHFEGRPTVAGGSQDLRWLHPSGREMSAEDWHDPRLHTLGMAVSGSPLRAPGPRGEQQHDASFLLWFTAATKPVAVLLPSSGATTGSREVVLSTDRERAAGARFEAGSVLLLAPRCVVVLREQA